MKTKIHMQGNTPRWAELAESPREVWAPTTETFLATLIGCAKEQSENDRARERAAARPAEARLDIRIDEDVAEEICAGPEPHLPNESRAAACATWRPGNGRILPRWTFMQPAIVPSADENPPAILCDDTDDAEIEAAAAPRQPANPILWRWTFMQPAIIPSAEAVTPAITFRETLDERMEDARVETTQTEEMIAAAPAPRAQRVMCRRALVRRTTAPSAGERASEIVREEAQAAEIEDVTPAPLIEAASAMPASESIAPEPAMSLQQEIQEARAEEIPAAEAITAVAPAIAVVKEAAPQAEAALAEPAAQLPAAMIPAAMMAPLPGRAAAGPGTLMRIWTWLNRKCAASATKQLRVTETVSLGEKRFVAVVHVEGQKFLIGGGASGVSLLTQLEPAKDEAGLDTVSSAVEGRA
jgi:hypothetical protein